MDHGPISSSRNLTVKHSIKIRVMHVNIYILVTYWYLTTLKSSLEFLMAMKYCYRNKKLFLCFIFQEISRPRVKSFHRRKLAG